MGETIVESVWLALVVGGAAFAAWHIVVGGFSFTRVGLVTTVIAVGLLPMALAARLLALFDVTLATPFQQAAWFSGISTAVWFVCFTFFPRWMLEGAKHPERVFRSE